MISISGEPILNILFLFSPFSKTLLYAELDPTK